MRTCCLALMQELHGQVDLYGVVRRINSHACVFMYSILPGSFSHQLNNFLRPVTSFRAHVCFRRQSDPRLLLATIRLQDDPGEALQHVERSPQPPPKDRAGAQHLQPGQYRTCQKHPYLGCV